MILKRAVAKTICFSPIKQEQQNSLLYWEKAAFSVTVLYFLCFGNIPLSISIYFIRMSQ